MACWPSAGTFDSVLGGEFESSLSHLSPYCCLVQFIQPVLNCAANEPKTEPFVISFAA